MADLPVQPASRVTVSILGEDYVISGGESKEYMKAIALIVDQRLQDMIRTHPKVPISKVAILTALNFADECHRLKSQHEELMRNIADAR